MNATEEGPGAATRVSGRTVLRTELYSPDSSSSHRRLAQELVWAWAREKWPALVPPPALLLSNNFERTLPDKRVVARGNREHTAWTLEVAFRETKAPVIWTSIASISDVGVKRVFAVETRCSVAPDTRPVAPPAFLRAWVDRLQFEDAGVRVLSGPRLVETDSDIAALQSHLLSSERRLPVVALVSKPQVRYFGVDPNALAQSVCGLAHVVCLTPSTAARFSEVFGRSLAPVHGFARFYLERFAADAASRTHPLLKLPEGRGDEEPASAGAVRRFVCRKVCEFSAGKVHG